jgi:hypothetical protein
LDGRRVIDSPEALELLASVFDRFGIEYMVGGSVASSITGLWRATQDIDIVARVRLDQTKLLERALIPDFYADSEAMRDAIVRGRAFNLIHFASSQKFDVFPILDNPYYEVEFSRRIITELRLPDGRVLKIPAATPEDIILAKLVWYRDGGCVSERQLGDIRGVLSVQTGRLDLDYLRKWAAHLGCADLLQMVFGPLDSI